MTESNDRVIHESPDGGETIYSRQVNSTERTLIYQSPTAMLRYRQYKWQAILAVAYKYPALENAIKQAEAIYEIVKENKE